MPSGLLRVEGTLDLSQYWPVGESDADTSKVVVGPDAFSFRPHPGKAFRVTHAFDDAVVRGEKGSRPAVDSKGRLTIRLQGVDAPELHYNPTLSGKPSAGVKAAFTAAKGKGEFRQRLGETATLALVKMLRGAKKDVLPCRVLSRVDSPNDVFDAYGRMVGDIVVRIGGVDVDVNHWLAAKGWAVPTYYSSMDADEIREIDSLAAKAMSDRKGVWGEYGADLTHFDFELRYRLHGKPDAAADAGPVIVPKAFRRQSVWAVSRRAGVFAGNMAAYLSAHPEACFVTKDFLEQGPHAAQRRTLDEFVKGAGTLTKRPQELVFGEAASKVVGPDGKPVKW